jgi:hypothetical protein
MGTRQEYKTYTRGVRIQDTNISFGKGMSFTNAPLEEGFSKLLINYDFGENGNTLVPRKGFQTTSEGLFDYPAGADSLEYKEDNTFLKRSDMSIVAGNRITHGARDYYQVIVGQITNYNKDIELYTGNAWVLTLVRTISQGTGYSLIHWKPLNSPGVNYCYFKKPREGDSTIHNITVSDSAYIKRHIGCFAFNGDYYYFLTDGNLYHTKFNLETDTYEPEIVTPYKPYQIETQNSLYNMLLENPYDFENQQAGNILSLTGFMPYKQGTNEPVLNPQVGIAYDYKLYFNYPKENEEYYLKVKWVNLDSETIVTINRDESETFTAGPEPWSLENLVVNSSKKEKLNAQFIIYAVPAEGVKLEGKKTIPEEALADAVILHASFSYYPEESSVLNHKLTKYDLSCATGMTYWKNRIWVFGAKDVNTGKIDNTVLFASDTNRPDWFPYTANADIFDEDIVCLQPMLDDLLVFTNHNLHSIMLSVDGITWSKNHLQSNLHITQWDLNLIQIVKNMVFFKSGNYYYMVVPKLTSASGAGLAIAPVSKNITGFLNDFEANVVQIVDDLYNYSCSSRFGELSKIEFGLKLVHYYNYLDYEDVHNTYVFECEKAVKTSYSQKTQSYTVDKQTVYLNFELLYNTVSRTWRIYIYESQRVRQPLFMNATGKGKYAEIVNYKGNACIQLLEYANNSTRDLYIKHTTEQAEATAPFVLENWQLLDTGSLNQNSDLKKRFREYQLKINNLSSSSLTFYSNFLIDKGIRLCEVLYSYEELPDDDEEDFNSLIIQAQPLTGNYGQPIVVSSEEASVKRQISTEFTNLGSWTLSKSKFPGITDYKVRVPVSGKGYLPRMIIISYNKDPYELLSCATVYRQLNSR